MSEEKQISRVKRKDAAMCPCFPAQSFRSAPRTSLLSQAGADGADPREIGNPLLHFETD